jgi:hypothetical protein
MILSIYLFFMIFAPRIGQWIDINAILSAFLIFRAFFTGAIEPALVRRSRMLISTILLCLLGYWFLVKFANRGQELYFLLRFLRILVQFLGVYALIRLYYRKYSDGMADKFLLHLYYVIGAHAVIMLIMYTVPPFREFIYSVTQVDVESLQGNWAQTGMRTGGLLTALDTLSAVQAFGIIIYPLVLPLLRGFKLLISNILLLIICFSVLVSGRTGFIIIILLSPLLLYHIKRELFKILPKVALGIFLFLLLAVIITPSEELQERIDWQVERLKNMFTSTEVGGSGLEIGATGKLIDDWLYDWPKDPAVLLFGNSFSARTPQSLVSADPGYILDVYGVGLIGLSLILSFYVLCLLQAKRCFPFHKKIALASLLYTLIVLLVNAKVRFAMAREGFTISVALFLITIYQQNFFIEDSVADEEYMPDLKQR